MKLRIDGIGVNNYVFVYIQNIIYLCIVCKYIATDINKRLLGDYRIIYSYGDWDMYTDGYRR